AAGVILLLGLAAALPLIILGSLSREVVARVRGRLLTVGHHGKTVLGLLFMGLGALVLSGADKVAEAWLLELMPKWLMAMTVSL
ncbi:MAG: cytochrome c biogenesis protein CcdA, partial [Thiobacillus sp.]